MAPIKNLIVKKLADGAVWVITLLADAKFEAVGATIDPIEGSTAKLLTRIGILKSRGTAVDRLGSL